MHHASLLSELSSHFYHCQSEYVSFFESHIFILSLSYDSFLCYYYLQKSAMFYKNAFTFNQDIGSWDVFNSKTFVSTAVNVIVISIHEYFWSLIIKYSFHLNYNLQSLMFHKTSAFNQHIGSWDVK